jgi:hypothetical protein
MRHIASGLPNQPSETPLYTKQSSTQPATPQRRNFLCVDPTGFLILALALEILFIPLD